MFGGGYNTVPVFLPALLRAFPAWSHQRVSILPSVLAASAGVSVLPVGWLIDRVEARVVMVFGVLAAGLSFMIASQSDALAPLIAAYLVARRRHLGRHRAARFICYRQLVYGAPRGRDGCRDIRLDRRRDGHDAGGGFVIRHWGWRVAYARSACR